MDKLINLKNINLPIPNNKPIILDHFCISIGDCIQIVAPSGRGKSYFYHTLLGMTEMAPIIFGNEGHLSNLFGYLPASLPFYSETVLDELKRVHVTANQINFFIEEGLINNEFLSYKCKNLSSGQNQLLILLRGLISTKPILIMDELMNAMDQERKNFIFDIVFKKILKNRAIIFSIHENFEHNYSKIKF